MSQKSYDKKCARELQAKLERITAKPCSYQFALNEVRKHMAASVDKMPAEIRADMIVSNIATYPGSAK